MVPRSMAQDLSEQLRKREPPAAQQQQQAKPQLMRSVRPGTIKATQGEQRKWDRQASYLREVCPPASLQHLFRMQRRTVQLHCQSSLH